MNRNEIWGSRSKQAQILPSQLRRAPHLIWRSAASSGWAPTRAVLELPGSAPAVGAPSCETDHPRPTAPSLSRSPHPLTRPWGAVHTSGREWEAVVRCFCAPPRSRDCSLLVWLVPTNHCCWPGRAASPEPAHSASSAWGAR